MAVSRLSIIKFFELVITLACLGLHYKSLGEPEDIKLLVSGTFVGFTIILVVLFLGYLMSEPLNKKLDIFLSVIACALFITSGVLIIDHWKDGWKTDARDLALAKGSLAIINGIVFLVDAFFTFRN